MGVEAGISSAFLFASLSGEMVTSADAYFSAIVPHIGSFPFLRRDLGLDFDPADRVLSDPYRGPDARDCGVGDLGPDPSDRAHDFSDLDLDPDLELHDLLLFCFSPFSFHFRLHTVFLKLDLFSPVLSSFRLILVVESQAFLVESPCHYSARNLEAPKVPT